MNKFLTKKRHAPQRTGRGLVRTTTRDSGSDYRATEQQLLHATSKTLCGPLSSKLISYPVACLRSITYLCETDTFFISIVLPRFTDDGPARRYLNAASVQILKYVSKLMLLLGLF